MAKTRVFISYDFSHDHGLKGDLVAQAARADSPFSISDMSLRESYPDDKWLKRARTAIDLSELFIVILGGSTHSAPGVLQEIDMARGLRKRRFQLRPQGDHQGPVQGAGPLVNWRWPNLKRAVRGQ